MSVVPHFILATRKSCWFVLHLEIKLLMKRMINRMQEFLEFETFFRLFLNPAASSCVQTTLDF